MQDIFLPRLNSIQKNQIKNYYNNKKIQVKIEVTVNISFFDKYNGGFQKKVVSGDKVDTSEWLHKRLCYQQTYTFDP